MTILVHHVLPARQWASFPAGPDPEDQHHLTELDAKLHLVRDRVTAVARGYATGLYLHGEGGLGKSYTVLQELRRLAGFVLFNSRMTGRGLFDQLQKFPDAVHVLEDMETLFRDKSAQGVLRSALWARREADARGPFPRPVSWTTYGAEEQFLFTGGIIVISNRALADVPELRAIKTRIACLQLEVTATEMRALMRQVAGRGYHHGVLALERAACLEVCDYLIEQATAVSRPLDMRLLVNAFHDRLQWEEADAACHWKDLVVARLRERPTALQSGMAVRGREARKRRERAVVEEILAASPDQQERIRLWAERTGKSPAAWYRRLAELAGQ